MKTFLLFATGAILIAAGTYLQNRAIEEAGLKIIGGGL